MRLRWATAIAMLIIHLVAVLAFFPAFFSWTGVALVFVGLYVFGTLGINVGYHRLLTHRGFKCPRWLERTFALLGVCSLEGGPARWVAMHRKHHQHSDEQPDPHSPLVNFLWGHIGWIIYENRDTDTAALAGKYARDLMTQDFYRKLEQKYRWLLVYVLHAVLFWVGGMIAGLILHPGDLGAASMYAAGIVVWGVAVRTVVVWHITWSVNSLSHLFGYQSHKTGENSRNNWLVALLSNGEGWHNNHHADQVCVAHGRKWWELDVTYITILGLRTLRLAWDLRLPDRHDHHDHHHGKPEAHA
ncbi:MAG: fatty acid desaturase [Planctomycetota bacterium]|nr:fatty acid desaturase [Planctomycetota bacterium]